MTWLLYIVTALLLLVLANRYFTRISMLAAIVLLVLPQSFVRLHTNRVYAPVEMPYMTVPLADHREAMHVPPPYNGALVDIPFQMIPWREALRRSIAAGEWPLINRYILCGDVLAGSMQPAAYSPFTWIALLLPAAMSFGYTAAIAFFIAGLGAYVFARQLQLNELAAIFAAVGWMLSAQLALTILWPLGFAWAFLPLVLAAVHRGSIPVLTVVFALEIVAGHPETTLHVVAIAAAYALITKRWRAMLISGVLALLITAIAWLPFIDASRHSGEYKLRTKIFAKEPLRLPGTKVRDAFIGDLFPFSRGGVHFPLERAEGGSILLALGIAAIFAVRRKEIAFFGAMLVVTFLAGINGWPVAQLLHKLPLFDSAFNDRLSGAVPFALAILAAFAMHAWPKRAMVIALIVVAIVMTIGAIHWWPLDKDRSVAEVAPLIVAVGLVAFARKEIAAPLLVTLLLIQRIISDGHLVPTHPKEIAYPHLALLDRIDAREPFRVAPYGAAMLPNTPTMYGLEDVRGNTPMTLASFGEILPLYTRRPDGWFLQVPDLTRPILSMMNVRYSVIEGWAPIPPGWHEVNVERNTRLIENEHVLPRAFVPARVTTGSTNDLAEMAQATDFAQRAWIALPEIADRENGPGRVTTTNGRDFEAHMERDGFVVISQAALPGWRAYLDDRRVKLLGANHAFLSVWVPAGEHKLRLRYLPQSFVVGRTITFATLALLAVFAIIRRRS